MAANASQALHATRSRINIEATNALLSVKSKSLYMCIRLFRIHHVLYVKYTLLPSMLPSTNQLTLHRPYGMMCTMNPYGYISTLLPFYDLWAQKISRASFLILPVINETTLVNVLSLFIYSFIWHPQHTSLSVAKFCYRTHFQSPQY